MKMNFEAERLEHSTIQGKKLCQCSALVDQQEVRIQDYLKSWNETHK